MALQTATLWAMGRGEVCTAVKQELVVKEKPRFATVKYTRYRMTRRRRLSFSRSLVTSYSFGSQLRIVFEDIECLQSSVNMSAN